MPDSPAELFDRHHLVIYRYLLRMTRRRDVAEDLTQEVFLKVIRGMDSYDDRGHPRAWLMSIARNLLIDQQRKSRREPTGVATDVAGGLPGPDVGIDLRQAIGRLPEADRDVFLLREVIGFRSSAELRMANTAVVPLEVRSWLR